MPAGGRYDVVCSRCRPASVDRRGRGAPAHGCADSTRAAAPDGTAPVFVDGAGPGSARRTATAVGGARNDRCAVGSGGDLVLDRQFRFLRRDSDLRPDHQRRGASVRAADHGQRGGPAAADRGEPGDRNPSDAPARPPGAGGIPRTACRRPGARCGWTPSTCNRARCGRCCCAPTTRGSGWRTATTSSTPPQGMVVHLTYDGVSTPYALGGGATDNRPE